MNPLPIWKQRPLLLLLACCFIAVSCRNDAPETAVAPLPATPTSDAPTPTAVADNDDFVVIATDAPNPPFATFDQFGTVDGFDAGVLKNLAEEARLDYELVVTPFEGVLENIASNGNRDFDAVIANLPIPEQPAEGIQYTEPYLEVGQVLMVLADDQALNRAADLQPGMAVGVVTGSRGEETAIHTLSLSADDIRPYDTSVQMLQALLDEQLRAVIADSYLATYYADAFPEQLKIVGGDGRDAWITQKSYAIALSAQDGTLKQQLNNAIVAAREAGDIDRLIVAWLIPQETLNPGEPRVGTMANEFAIGMLGQLEDMDPAGINPDFISWEIKNNTMSGLYMLNADNEIVPLLASDLPQVSADGLEYTIILRRGLTFPDDTELTAEDVKWSIDRARSLGNFLVNDFLKDSNEDNFADDDAVQIIDQYTVKLVLQEPTSYFLSLLATPAYFPVSNECYALTWDYSSTCGGIGPYNIVSWTDTEMQLRANPEWPGRPAPAFENLIIRFYDSAETLRRSIEQFGSVDLAWTGLPYADFLALSNMDTDGDGRSDFTAWTGPGVFKSYLIFNQETEPWDSEKVRQAANLSLDREALAVVFEGSRSPLLSLFPETLPGYTAVFPTRDLTRARALLLEEGYSQTTPLAVTLSFVNDGRYSDREEAYATAIKSQLEETGVFQVTLNGAPWEFFAGQLAGCNYGISLLGWPSPGRPVNYFDASAWTDFIITSSAFCPNYESETMTTLLQDSAEAPDTAVREAALLAIQQLWAKNMPTIPLLQEPRIALSRSTVDNVRIDGLGLLHYELLTKGGG